MWIQVKDKSTIIYTHTDEAPLLATYSFLPIIAGVRRRGRRRRSRPATSRWPGGSSPQFPDRLTDEQRVDDALAELGELAKTPEANIIKLPNISASIPQLKAAIAELQAQGYDLPDYPDEPADRRGAATSAPATTRSRAARSTRCCARATPTAARRASVKSYARNAPALDGRVVAGLEDQRRAR